MISEKILEFAKKGRARVAIGLIKTNPEIIASLHRAEEFADIIIVGEKVDKFKSEFVPEQGNREAIIGQKMAGMLRGGVVSAIVRGNMEAYNCLHEVADLFGHKKILRVSIIKDQLGREFLLAPAALAEGNSMGERLGMAFKMAEFIYNLGILPKIAVLQIYDSPVTENIAQSMDEAAYIAEKLTQKGWKVGFVGYAVEKAVESCNVIVSSNGIIGNAIWRTITGFKAGQDLGDFSLIPEVLVDDSKFWDDYYQPIVFAAALVNMKKNNE
jgi:predicted methyltransferase MtxX (methanogen marker protein 4)